MRKVFAKISLYVYVLILSFLFLVLFILLPYKPEYKGLADDYLQVVPARSWLVMSIPKNPGAEWTQLIKILVNIDPALNQLLAHPFKQPKVKDLVLVSGQDYKILLGRFDVPSTLAVSQLKHNLGLKQRQNKADWQYFTSQNRHLLVRGDVFVWALDETSVSKVMQNYKNITKSKSQSNHWLELSGQINPKADWWVYFNPVFKENLKFTELEPLMVSWLNEQNQSQVTLTYSINEPKSAINMFLPDFSGSYITGTNWRQDYELLKYLLALKIDQPIPYEQLSIDDFASQFSGEYQLYINDKSWLAVWAVNDIRDLEGSIENLELAWRRYVAKDFPKEQEVILADGTKAVHLVRDIEAVEFQEENFLEKTIYYLPTSDQNEVLAIMITDQYLLLANNLDFIKKSLTNEQQPNGSGWLSWLKENMASSKTITQDWFVKISDLEDLANPIGFLTDYLSIKIQTQIKDGMMISNIILRKR